jgi:hypothetical protein
MMCSKCGCEQVGPAQFCRQCGAALVDAVPPPYATLYANRYAPYAAAYPTQRAPRVQRNLQTLGILWCVYGAYRILAGIAGIVAFRLFAHSGAFSDMPPFVSHLVGSVAPAALLLVVLLGVANVVTGYHLLTRQPWARVLAIVMAVLALFKLPVGTGLGIYTLWVLAPQASGAEWDGMTRMQTA